MKKDSKATRPANAWILYMKAKRDELKQLGSTIIPSEIFRHIGRLWAKETEEVKKYYAGLSLQGQLEHQKTHPYYRIMSRVKKEAEFEKLVTFPKGKKKLHTVSTASLHCCTTPSMPQMSWMTPDSSRMIMPIAPIENYFSLQNSPPEFSRFYSSPFTTPDRTPTPMLLDTSLDIPIWTNFNCGLSLMYPVPDMSLVPFAMTPSFHLFDNIIATEQASDNLQAILPIPNEETFSNSFAEFLNNYQSNDTVNESIWENDQFT